MDDTQARLRRVGDQGSLHLKAPSQNQQKHRGENRANKTSRSAYDKGDDVDWRRQKDRARPND